MSDLPHVSTPEEHTAVNQLIEKQRERLIEETNERLEQQIRLAIQQTDWSEVEVLDIVYQVRMTEYGGFDGETGCTRSHSFQYHGYESQQLAPSVDTYYGIGDHHKQVYRLTEYACREAGIDPVTGEDAA